MLLSQLVLKKLLTHPLYDQVSKELASSQGLPIMGGVDDQPQIIRIYQNEFLTSGCREEDLIVILEHDRDRFKQFFLKTVELEGNDDVNGEFPPGEEQGEQELASGGHEGLGYSKYFLLSLLIRFDYLKKDNLIGLTSFFQNMRIPHAKKFARELKGLYDSVVNILILK